MVYCTRMGSQRLALILTAAECAAIMAGCAHPANPCQQLHVVQATPANIFNFENTPEPYNVELDDGHIYSVTLSGTFVTGPTTGQSARLCTVVSKIDGSTHYSLDSRDAQRVK